MSAEDSRWFEDSPSDAESIKSETLSQLPELEPVTSSTASDTSTTISSNTDTPATSSSSNVSQPLFNKSIPLAMAGISKRVALQRPLGKEETISTFESWRGNLIYILNSDEHFPHFWTLTKFGIRK